MKLEKSTGILVKYSFNANVSQVIQNTNAVYQKEKRSQKVKSLHGSPILAFHHTQVITRIEQNWTCSVLKRQP